MLDFLKNDKVIKTLPHLYFLIYILLSILFYKERIIYTDNSYFLYTIIESENFAIFHNRWVGVFSQWLPLLMVKLSAPIEVVAISFSLNLALVYYISYLIISHLLKMPIFSLILIFVTGILQHFSYYWQVSELNSGFSIFSIILCYLVKSINNKSYTKLFLVSIICTFLIQFIHPLSGILILICLFGIYLYDKNLRLILAIFIILIGFIIKVLLLSDFEKSKLDGFDMNLLTISKIKESYLYYSFKEFLKKQFFIPLLLMISFSISLFFKKRIILFSYVITTFVLLFFLIYYNIPYGEIITYMETYFSIMFVPFIILFFIIIQKHFSHYYNFVLFGVIILGCYRLSQTVTNKYFEDRLLYIHDLTNSDQVLSYCEIEELDLSKLFTTWALPYETLIYSTIQGQSKSVYYNEFDIDIKNMQDTTVFLGASWEQYKPLKSFNQKYFKIENQAYQPLTLQ